MYLCPRHNVAGNLAPFLTLSSYKTNSKKMYLLIARSILIKLIKCRNLNRRYKNIQYKGYFMHRVYVVSGLVPLPEFYWRNVPNSIHFPFLSWLVFYANFNIISVISRQQFTYIWSQGKQTSTRLQIGSCPRAMHLERRAATGDQTRDARFQNPDANHSTVKNCRCFAVRHIIYRYIL